MVAFAINAVLNPSSLSPTGSSLCRRMDALVPQRHHYLPLNRTVLVQVSSMPGVRAPTLRCAPLTACGGITCTSWRSALPSHVVTLPPPAQPTLSQRQRLQRGPAAHQLPVHSPLWRRRHDQVCCVGLPRQRSLRRAGHRPDHRISKALLSTGVSPQSEGSCVCAATDVHHVQPGQPACSMVSLWGCQQRLCWQCRCPVSSAQCPAVVSHALAGRQCSSKAATGWVPPNSSCAPAFPHVCRSGPNITSLTATSYNSSQACMAPPLRGTFSAYNCTACTGGTCLPTVSCGGSQGTCDAGKIQCLLDGMAQDTEYRCARGCDADAAVQPTRACRRAGCSKGRNSCSVFSVINMVALPYHSRPSVAGRVASLWDDVFDPLSLHPTPPPPPPPPSCSVSCLAWSGSSVSPNSNTVTVTTDKAP